MDDATGSSALSLGVGWIGEPAFWWPDWIPISAWHEHMPFAFWLISAARPRSFVELGTHAGASYCAFCQAIDRLSVDCRAFAVDTWRGDEQSGLYGDDVLQQLQSYHDQRYGRFSRLVKSTFDEALSHFDDRSIDLLHIDGFHTYDAVRHDFESWMPKLSARAVVLFHDTSVHERDFGVARLWEEISGDRPHFAFDHGHGLGVLAVGFDVPRALQPLFACGASANEARSVRMAYARLGRAISDSFQATQAAAEWTRIKEGKDGENAQLRVALSEAAGQREALQADRKAARAQVATLVEELAQSKQQAVEAIARAEAATAERERLSLDLEREQRGRRIAEQRTRDATKTADAIRASWASRFIAPLLMVGERKRQRRRERRQKREVAFIAGAKLIDPEWYLQTNPDVAASGIDPIVHYVESGAYEGRKPHPDFDSLAYLDENPDVARLELNPLVHFERYGKAEGRMSGARRGRLGVAETYALWQSRYDYEPARDRQSLQDLLAGLRRRPKISVLMPVYNPDPKHLENAIRSVEEQVYDEWELCIADDASTDPRIRPVLEAAKVRDDRVKITYRPTNGHISEASNSALELVTGEYVALLDHDDVLREHALAEVALEIDSHPDAGLIYSDEDKLDKRSRRYDAYFKPDFSRELFRSQNYLNHLTVHRTENIRAVGGWRRGFEGSQDYDLNLRIFERIGAEGIRHIPKVLYHWRAVPGSTAQAGSEKSYAYTAGLRALEEHVVRTGLAAKVEAPPKSPFYRLRLEIPEPRPLVSLIIPTRDKVELLRGCIASILEKTTYDNYEIIVVDNGSVADETLAYFETLKANRRIRILRDDRPFNYSAINNLAVSEASGEIVGLINNDIEVISPDWLTEMVSWVIQPDVGCVGARLYYADDTVQHAGVVLGVGGVANHAHLGVPRRSPGYFGRAIVHNNYSAVTAACLLVRKSVFQRLGGFDEKHLPIAFNDVDFCLKARAAGYSNVYTPFAELYHFESQSRGSEDTAEKAARFAAEVSYIQKKWAPALLADPFYSVNLSRRRSDFTFLR